MGIVLGVWNGNDSGAVLVRDGKVIAAVGEERFNREKLTRSFPEKAIDFCLQHGQVLKSEIDVIACGAWPEVVEKETIQAVMTHIETNLKSGNVQGALSSVRRVLRSGDGDVEARRKLHEGLESIGLGSIPVELVSHHLSHAVTAFAPSPFLESLVLVIDGRGDFRSTSLWHASLESGYRLLHETSELASLGILYGVVTRLLGFIPDRHEGKVMGLAARGRLTDCVDFLQSFVRFSEIDGSIFVDYSIGYEPFLLEGSRGLESVLSGYRREDVAFAIQFVLEDLIVNYLRFHTRSMWEEGYNLCLAGGVASNVRMNMKLRQLEAVKNVYVAPAMTDGGNALGGALAFELGAPWKAQKTVLENFYLGPEFSEDDILADIQLSGLKFQCLTALESEELILFRLRAGDIVGVFQGRSEFGPRALGNRSILASPASPGVAKELNARLNRNEFMPFGPVTISELAGQCFLEWEESHSGADYMTMCYSVTDWFRDLCPSVVHVDGTVRPQVLRRDKNPSYHSLVSKFFSLEGLPALINTSFNLHEEPIVNSPADALKAIERGAIDVLHIGPFIVTAATDSDF